jgi:hypothetical protein
VKLSALSAGRVYTAGRFIIPIYIKGFVDPRKIERLKELGELKYNIIGNRTGGLSIAEYCLKHLRFWVPQIW